MWVTRGKKKKNTRIEKERTVEVKQSPWVRVLVSQKRLKEKTVV